MAEKQKKPRWRNTRMPETDGGFLLKLALYVLLSTFWVKFGQPLELGALPLNGVPVGFMIGIVLASREKRQINRKIAYATLLVITILCYFFPAGVVI